MKGAKYVKDEFSGHYSITLGIILTKFEHTVPVTKWQ